MSVSRIVLKLSEDTSYYWGVDAWEGTGKTKMRDEDAARGEECASTAAALFLLACACVSSISVAMRAATVACGCSPARTCTG